MQKRKEYNEGIALMRDYLEFVFPYALSCVFSC